MAVEDPLTLAQIVAAAAALLAAGGSKPLYDRVRNGRRNSRTEDQSVDAVVDNQRELIDAVKEVTTTVVLEGEKTRSTTRSTATATQTSIQALALSQAELAGEIRGRARGGG